MNAIYNLIMAALGTLIFIVMVVKIFKIKGSTLKKIVYNSIAGFAFLLIFNLFGGIWGFKIGVNLITLLISAVVGIPGVITLILVKMIVR